MERLLPRRVEEVEEPHVVGTGVRAVARTDAAVVDLRVEPLVGMMARIGRAHRLARRVVALLAHHGPELQPHVREIAFPVALDADPVLRAPERRLLIADGRDVVLRMTRRHAGAAPGAGIELYRHSPTRHQFPSL